jgi:3-hydroxyisobutyrate dehydrogenase
LELLQQGLSKTELHQVFDPHLFPDLERVQELPAVEEHGKWQPLGPFEAAIDIFQDGSVFVVHAPGHLPGHVNLLCRVGEKRWMYLGGDSCHDTRLLSGERSIATWTDPHGHMQCIHLNKTRAEDTLRRIRQLMQSDGEHVEVVLAHDGDWWLRNQDKAFPACLN